MSRCFSSAYRLNRAVPFELRPRRLFTLPLLSILLVAADCGHSNPNDISNKPSRHKFGRVWKARDAGSLLSRGISA
jgi:hypothetical protein